ncbi:MAG: UDP-2,3-diacylglucosamine diphosphatase [Thiothrix sp.]|nr:UDP-2,3-diacylglucosamine diphosphatase [Thiothrix sp.]HPE60645.1 UDP-2,3-diacylglucosamine diphosphatase [Thiolinea sp.]
MSTWFISDLHLDPARPAGTRLLLEFLEHIRGRADGLYLLGDVFEFWIGDDVLDSPAGQGVLPVVEALERLSASGVPLYFQHGNRDFLIGAAFAARAGCTLLPQEQVISLYERPVLLMHGDQLCTDDQAYQQARRQFRDPEWQRQALAMSIPQRLETARRLRLQSHEHNKAKTEAIMDVNQQAVEQAMRTHAVECLIHGHTHRPGIHAFSLDGRDVQRIVLGDWHEGGSFLRMAPGQQQLDTRFA